MRYRSDKSIHYRAGICNYRRHMRYEGSYLQECVATVSVNVALYDGEERCPISKITHLVSGYSESLRTPWSLQGLIDSIYGMHASDISVVVRIPLSFLRHSPCSHIDACVVYDSEFQLHLYNGELIPNMICTFPLVTVCPCSLANSAPFAHMQRIYATLCLNSDDTVLLDDILREMELCASEKTYPIIRQADEKVILERAYNQACFAEEVTRSMASSLQSYASIQGFKICIQSLESLHPHDITAYVEYNYSSCCIT